MNYKFGDLAAVVRNTFGTVCPELMGVTLTCREPVSTIYGPGWLLKKPMACPRCGGAVFGFFDADLQPLRPGPEKADASDSQDIRSGEVASHA